MKAKIFLYHDQDGYRCEVFLNAEQLANRVVTFIRTDAANRKATGFLRRMAEFGDNVAKMADAYGQHIFMLSKKSIKLAVLEGVIMDPENFILQKEKEDGEKAG